MQPHAWSDYFSWADPALVPIFEVLGAPVTPLELLAFLLSLWMVGCNLRVNIWGWPLAIISSLLYGVFFARGRLYGEASLQLVFVAVSCWGWWSWLRGPQHSDERAEVVLRLPMRGHVKALVSALIGWPLMGLVLRQFTDSDVPFWDALPTTLSLVGQYLLGKKYVENWPVWLIVNGFSMALFAHKGYWLTVILYGIFALLSVLGWRQWLKLPFVRA
ncbi:MAG TPA: nicotinamide riboside transporter PnuC [Aquabacterium sp.]|nr:nicotinamide riboside transporter PnuC [Aquabacterium sp.]